MTQKFSEHLVRLLSIITILTLAFSIPAFTSTASASTLAAPALSDSSIMFIQNVGQFDDQALFQVWGGNASTWLVRDGYWVSLVEDVQETEDDFPGDPATQDSLPQEGVNVKISFVDANPNPVIEPIDRLETSVNYFLGNDPNEWHSNVPVWGGVRYVDLYPGIDLEVYSQGGQLSQRLVADEGADLNVVRLDVQGADSLSVENGQLLLSTSVGDLALPLLQVSGIKGVELQIPAIVGNYVYSPFANRKEVRKTENSLSADPKLLYSVIFGSEYHDYGYDIAVDSMGRAYVTGIAATKGFPITPGVFDRTHNGGNDSFVVRINPTGSTLSYATFLGGSSSDSGLGIAINERDEVFVTGNTYSTDFPVSSNALDNTLAGYQDAYIVKLNHSGSELLYSSYIGGEHYDSSKDLTINNDIAWITGSTTSSDFPVTELAVGNTCPAVIDDIYIIAVNTSNSTLEFSTCIGGSLTDVANGIFIDSSDYIFVTGTTNSSDFPTTAGVIDGFNETNQEDGFILKMNPDGSAYVYSTYIGKSQYESSNSIYVDSDGAAYITGETSSWDFPTTSGAYDTAFDGDLDAFITKLNPSGTSLDYSTYLNGTNSNTDYGQNIIVDENGQAYVAGITYSEGFPVTQTAIDKTYNGMADVFIAKLNSTGSSLLYSTYFGGTSSESVKNLTMDSNNSVYFVGQADTYNFPRVNGSFVSSRGSPEVYVAKIGVDNDIPAVPVPLSPSGGESITGVPTYTWKEQLDAGYFIFEYDNNSDFSSPVFTSTEIVGYQFTANDYNVGTFYWHIKAGDLAGNWSDWSAKRKIIIKPEVPVTPALVAPAQGQYTKDSTPLLKWKSVIYGYKYKVQVSKTNTFTTNLVDTTLNPGVLSYTVLTKLADGNYYWRVQAINTLGQTSPWSVIRNFRVDTVAPEAPRLSSPANKSTVYENTPFKWRAATGASYYQISFSGYPGFKPILFMTAKFTGTTYTLNEMENGNWYWRVRSLDKAGNMSEWSVIWLVIKK